MSDAYAFEIGKVFQPAGIAGNQTLGSLLGTIVGVLIGATFTIAVFFIIIGGIRIVTAGGDMKKIQAAQAQITYAIIGLVVTILAFVIIQVVQYFFGSSVPI